MQQRIDRYKYECGDSECDDYPPSNNLWGQRCVPPDVEIKPIKSIRSEDRAEKFNLSADEVGDEPRKPGGKGSIERDATKCGDAGKRS